MMGCAGSVQNHKVEIVQLNKVENDRKDIKSHAQNNLAKGKLHVILDDEVSEVLKTLKALSAPQTVRSYNHGLEKTLTIGGYVDVRCSNGLWCSAEVVQVEKESIRVNLNRSSSVDIVFGKRQVLAPFRTWSQSGALVNLSHVLALVTQSNGLLVWKYSKVVQVVGSQMLVSFRDLSTPSAFAMEKRAEPMDDYRSCWVHCGMGEILPVPTLLTSFDSDTCCELFDHDLICCICSSIPLLPVSPMKDGKEFCCGIVVCHNCLEAWKNKSDVSGAKCPQCQQVFVDFQSSALAIKKISGLKIRCPNSTLGCPFTTLVGVRGQHVHDHLNDCRFKMVQCPDCRQSMIHRDLFIHWHLLCPKRSIPCLSCGDIVVADQMTKHVDQKTHQDLKCRGQVFCPNNCTSLPKAEKKNENLHPRSLIHHLLDMVSPLDQK